MSQINGVLSFVVEFSPYVFTFIVGLFAGSFLNVVADRTVREESFLSGRSYCEDCGTTLVVRDLIPVFSFLYSKGKCRYCGSELSWTYPISEIMTGSILSLALAISGFSSTFLPRDLGLFLYLSIIFSFYIIIFLTDLKYQLIPNRIVFPAIVFALFGSLWLWHIGIYPSLGGSPLFWEAFGRSFQFPFVLSSGLSAPSYLFFWASNLLSAGILSVFFLFLHVITRGKGMGLGDVRLAFLIGLIHPFPQDFAAIFGSFVLGAVVGILLMIAGSKGMKDRIAFGPFMILSSLMFLI